MNLKDLLLTDAVLSEKLHIPPARLMLHRTAAFLAHSGDGWFWVAFLLIGWLLGPAPWSSTALVFLAGVFITAGPVMALKFMLRRPRPEGTWGQVYRRTDPHSFPSGHAARVAMFATLGFLITPPWVGVTFVVWGLLVVISRVALGVHYFADVVVGLGVGVVFGFLTYSLNLLLPFSSILPMLAGG